MNFPSIHDSDHSGGLSHSKLDEFERKSNVGTLLETKLPYLHLYGLIFKLRVVAVNRTNVLSHPETVPRRNFLL